MARRRRTVRPRLAAGRVIEFAFPQLPATLHAKHTGRKAPAMMAIHLPRDYTTRATFPLLAYLDGGHGAPGNRKGLAKVRKITADRGLIAVSLPLFKRDLDPEEIYGGLLIGAHDDYPMIARCYRTMLKELTRAVPNIAFERSAFGGFSNGAHTAALLLSALHRTVLRCFRSFYLIEGGSRVASFHKTALRGRRFLFMVGALRGDRRRQAWLRTLRGACDLARASGLDVTLRRMPKVRHGFPETHMPLVRRWVCRMNGDE